jgi:hypothetical protein
MTPIQQAWQDLGVKIITTISSVKFWVMVATIALGALVAYNNGGNIILIIIGVLTALTGGSVYTTTKVKQNVELAKVDANTKVEIAKAFGNGVPLLPAQGTPVNIIEAKPSPLVYGNTAIYPAFANLFPNKRLFVPAAITVQDRIDVGLKFLGDLNDYHAEAIWDFLLGWMEGKVHDGIEKVLELNPELGTIEATQAFVEQYIGESCSPKDCETILSVKGLFDAVQAYKGQIIYNSFYKSFWSGNSKEKPFGMLGKAKWIELIGVARLTMVQTIVNSTLGVLFHEAIPPEPSNIEARKQVLREFGISEKNIKGTQFSGVMVVLGDGEQFNPYNHLNTHGVLTPWGTPESFPK